MTRRLREENRMSGVREPQPFESLSARRGTAVSARKRESEDVVRQLVAVGDFTHAGQSELRINSQPRRYPQLLCVYPICRTVRALLSTSMSA